MSAEESTIRRCKNIRDRFYDPAQRPGAVFRRTVLQLLSPESSLVDIGCGRDATFLRATSPRVKSAWGVDLEVLDTIVDGNIRIMRGNAEAMPLCDQSADVVTMINVVEHLPNPERVFCECARVLKPGGSLVLTAPSAHHPPTFLGRAFPHSIRQWANLLITGTRGEDTFPAYYRANTARTLRRLGSVSGLRVARIEYLSNHPQYFMFSTSVYRCAVAIERHVLQRELFRRFRQQILCQLLKPDVAK